MSYGICIWLRTHILQNLGAHRFERIKTFSENVLELNADDLRWRKNLKVMVLPFDNPNESTRLTVLCVGQPDFTLKYQALPEKKDLGGANKEEEKKPQVKFYR